MPTIFWWWKPARWWNPAAMRTCCARAAATLRSIGCSSRSRARPSSRSRSGSAAKAPSRPRTTPRPRQRLLQQAFRLHGFLHFRPRLDAVEIGGDVFPLAEIDADARRPAQHCEQMGVGDGELVAHQVLFAGELLVDPIEALPEQVAQCRLEVVRRGRTEQRREGLV